MSAATELWKKWEGRVVDGKFRLRQGLGGSDHSAVFLTEQAGEGSQRAAVKLIPVEKVGQEYVGEDDQLSRWAEAAKLSHPHLIRLLEYGRCQIDDTRLLYIVMEYAEENLAEILPLRVLSADEALEMLRPAAEALAALHRAGFVQGRIKPANIMAVDNQLKLSTDGLGKTGERGNAPSAYDAPEIVGVGLSQAGDIWSLGSTLLAVLTQNEPTLSGAGAIVLPETIPQPLREIVQRCLLVDPQRRCGAGDILSQLQGDALPPDVPIGATAVEANTPQGRPKRWIVVPIVVAALFLIALVGGKFLGHQPAVPAAETRPAQAQPPAEISAAQTPAPFSTKQTPVQKANVRGSVLQQVMPDVSRSAQNTIDGKIKVSVQVEVDPSGNVSQARLTSPGPSKYFADRALAAARRWKFNPPVVDGQAAGSAWVLRFQFRRAGTEVFPAETKP